MACSESPTEEGKERPRREGDKTNFVGNPLRMEMFLVINQLQFP